AIASRCVSPEKRPRRRHPNPECARENRRRSGSDHMQGLAAPAYRIGDQTLVERGQAAFIFDGQGQQVGVSHLSARQQPIKLDRLAIQHTEVICPEVMLCLRTKSRQQSANMRRWAGTVWVARMSDDAQ